MRRVGFGGQTSACVCDVQRGYVCWVLHVYLHQRFCASCLITAILAGVSTPVSVTSPVRLRGPIAASMDAANHPKNTKKNSKEEPGVRVVDNYIRQRRGPETARGQTNVVLHSRVWDQGGGRLPRSASAGTVTAGTNGWTSNRRTRESKGEGG